MHVRFLRDYDYTPSVNRLQTFAFKAGESRTVKQECGLAAVKAGAAVKIPAPRRVDAGGQ